MNTPNQRFTLLATYAMLAQFAQAFARGQLSFLILEGPGGVGKSHAFKTALGGAAHFIEGSASPFGLYQVAYEHVDELIVLDDVDGLARNADAVRLLKALCQSTRSKTVMWTKDAAFLEKRGIPCQFRTTSPVAIITNE
jgi:hypothetical protein